MSFIVLVEGRARNSAEFQCEKSPVELGEGQCKDRDTTQKELSERSSGKGHKPKKKYCFDCDSTMISRPPQHSAMIS